MIEGWALAVVLNFYKGTTTINEDYKIFYKTKEDCNKAAEIINKESSILGDGELAVVCFPVIKGQ